MAKSYTTGRNLAGTWTKNSSSTNLTYLDQVANDGYRALCAIMDWPFLERQRTITTTASTQGTTLPYDCDLVREISVVPSGSTFRYTPRIINDRETWDRINLQTSSPVSDIPEFAFIYAGQVLLNPIPASANTIYVQQKTRVIDLSVADITSTTVTTVTSGSTSVTVSGGVTALMAGMWIRITYTPGTTNTGDGLWYEISGVSGSTITLVRAYGGTSIAAGTAACTIAQMPLLPEAFHDLPWLWASGTYWQKEADKRAQSFFDIHGEAPRGGRPATGKVRDMIAGYANATTDFVLEEGVGRDLKNPNLFINL